MARPRRESDAGLQPSCSIDADGREDIRMDQAMAIRLAIIAGLGVAIGFAATFAAWWKRGRSDAGQTGQTDNEHAGPAWALPLTAGLAYLILHVAVLGRAPWPMTSAQDRVPVAAIAALVLAILARRVRFPVVVRWIVRALVVLVVGVFIAWRQVSETWSTSQSAITLGGFVGSTLLTWWALERVTDRPPTSSTSVGGTVPTTASAARANGVSAALVASAVAGAAANAMAITYSSLSLAQLAGILATVMIGVALACVLRPRISLAFGGAHVVAVVTQAVLLVGIITTATAYERVYPWLVAAVPIAAVLVDAALAPRSKAWVRAAARVVAAAIVVGAITGLAVANMPTFEY